MGLSISKDLIDMVQLRVHHYETRCALRLACKRFAEHISIFDNRALPIVSNTSYQQSQADGGLKWKGRFTYSSSSRGGLRYMRFCFRKSLRFFFYSLVRGGTHASTLVYDPPEADSYLRFSSRSSTSRIDKIIRALTKHVNGAWYSTHDDALLTNPAHDLHGLTMYDLVNFERVRVGERAPQDDEDRMWYRIYMEYHDYCAMIHELECIRQIRADFPSPVNSFNLDEDYQRAQKRKRLTE